MIKIKNLTKSYSYKGTKKYIFKDLNMTIKTGESVAILGGNGSGKSTLLRIIGGIDIPDSGTIEKDCSISWPLGVAAGFQGSLTARENITFITKIYSSNKKEDIKEKIEIVKEFADIGEYFDRPYKTYSSGMKGRVSFGLSMAFPFDVYLLDEVTAKGDSYFKKKCTKALDILKKRSSFILTSHNLNFLNRHADKAFVIDKYSLISYDNINTAHEESTKLLPKNIISSSNIKK